MELGGLGMNNWSEESEQDFGFATLGTKPALLPRRKRSPLTLARLQGRTRALRGSGAGGLATCAPDCTIGPLRVSTGQQVMLWVKAGGVRSGAVNAGRWPRRRRMNLGIPGPWGVAERLHDARTHTREVETAGRV